MDTKKFLSKNSSTHKLKNISLKIEITKYLNAKLLMNIPSYFYKRWKKELKYWRLRWWQFALLLLWSAWSWICGWLFPGNPDLWLLPQAPFLIFGYLGGGLLMTVFPSQPWAYPIGSSSTVFLLTYLVIVGWRWRREDKHLTPPHNTKPPSCDE